MAKITPKQINKILEEGETLPVIINGRKVVEIGHGRTVRVSEKYYEAVCQIAFDAGITCEVEKIDGKKTEAKTDTKDEAKTEKK